MAKLEAKEAPKPPVKVELALPSLYQGNGSYTENPKGVRDVQFVMPGSRTRPVEVLHVDSTAVPQPFVDPAVFKEWSGKS
ncbi:hypothetical protein LZ30DRAFT_585791 [Colletotrichum cereale]|nr:hypothetical protein LZ30DRAFT_585791 [Colletotrichum cereale]